MCRLPMMVGVMACFAWVSLAAAHPLKTKTPPTTRKAPATTKARPAPKTKLHPKAVVKLLQKVIALKHIPGLAVAIVRGKKVLVAQGLGWRDLKGKKPVTPKTLFAIGSTTKAITATALGALVDKGKLKWRTPIRRHLPSFRLRDPVATAGMTAVDLLSHRSGMPRHDLVWYGVNPTRKQLFSRLHHLQFSKPFRAAFQYNNLMYFVAGYLGGKLYGGGYEKLVQEQLFGPLGMKRANFSVTEMQKDADSALPYVKSAKGFRKVPYRNIDAIGPAGSVNADIQDMARWVQLQLNRGKVGDVQLLRRKTLAFIHQPHMVTSSSRGFQMLRRFTPNLGHISYGLGWAITQFRDRPLLFHNGAIDGFTATVSFMPRHDVGIVLLSNRGRNPFLSYLLLECYDRLFGDPKVQRVTRFLKILKKLRAHAKKRAQAPDKHQKKGTQPTHPLTALAGTYTHPAYGSMRVTVDKDPKLLHLEFHTLKFRFAHYHYNTFQAINAKGQPLSRKFKMRFFINDHGEIGRVTVPWQGGVAPIAFARKAGPKKAPTAPQKRPVASRKSPAPPALPARPTPPRKRAKKRKKPKPRPKKVLKRKHPNYKVFSSYEDMVKEAQRLKRPIFLDLFASWCAPCKQLEKEVFSHPLIHPLLEKFLVVRFDVDKSEGSRLTRHFGVNYYPTTLVLDASGQEVERIVGYYAARHFRPPLLAAINNKGTYAQLVALARSQPTNQKALLSYADRLLLRREVQGARNIYRSLWQGDPKNANKIGAWALFGVARCHARMSRYRAARPLLERFHRDFPGKTGAQIEAYRLHIYALRKLRKWRQRRALLEAFKKKFPGKSHVFK